MLCCVCHGSCDHEPNHWFCDAHVGGQRQSYYARPSAPFETASQLISGEPGPHTCAFCLKQGTITSFVLTQIGFVWACSAHIDDAFALVFPAIHS